MSPLASWSPNPCSHVRFSLRNDTQLQPELLRLLHGRAHVSPGTLSDIRHLDVLDAVVGIRQWQRGFAPQLADEHERVHPHGGHDDADLADLDSQAGLKRDATRGRRRGEHQEQEREQRDRREQLQLQRHRRRDDQAHQGGQAWHWHNNVILRRTLLKVTRKRKNMSQTLTMDSVPISYVWTKMRNFH